MVGAKFLESTVEAEEYVEIVETHDGARSFYDVIFKIEDKYFSASYELGVASIKPIELFRDWNKDDEGNVYVNEVVPKTVTVREWQVVL